MLSEIFVGNDDVINDMIGVLKTADEVIDTTIVVFTDRSKSKRSALVFVTTIRSDEGSQRLRRFRQGDLVIALYSVNGSKVGESALITAGP